MVSKIHDLATFAMYKRVRNYAQLNWTVRDYDSETRAFRTTPASAKGDSSIQETNTFKHVKLMVRLVAWVVNVEAKIDTLADQMANVAHILKLSDSKRT